ncbi:hypothetical protein [Halalkalibacter sp. APA_J-10(15)]|uniref:hypothetical protein n=1 Tax=unclassified Halalkalibacter TaxID=2893063 RepID=UPI001FF4F8A9|nr:hypothetical protein [Halalkalibacter sp. APA_J-10(15)]MCK0473576.1 hypothetical protein [Halalkalibacter sp. APA_J-10(15)]
MRVLPDLENTVFIQHAICVPVNIDQVFEFFISNHLSTYYREISKDHEYLTLREGNRLEVGSILDCLESVSNQTAVHEYVVSEIIHNERIRYHSTPSHIKIKLPWKEIDSKSNTHCFFDFDKVASNKTKIRLTIGVQFYSKFEKLFSTLSGGLSPWKKHCMEEQEGLKKLIAKKLITY